MMNDNHVQIIDSNPSKGNKKFMPDEYFKNPQEVAARLDVSSSTLHRWSDEFGQFLSKQANETKKGKNGRRYSDDDISNLLIIKEFMDDGLTYEQVRQRLNQQHENEESSLLVTQENISMAAMSYVSDTMEDLRQGQLSVLNSQAANRELMGVLIQDNFNLKEENGRLRDRVLDVERQISQVRRDEESRREMVRQEFEAKLMEIREIATSSRNPITVLQTRAGCLGSLFGGGSKVQTLGSQEAPASHEAMPGRPTPPRPPGPPE